jgi:hypothetical protein
MAGDGIRKDLRELREQIEALREALAQATKPYAELAGYIEQLQSLSRGYFRILGLVQRHGAVSPDLAVPGLKDDISRHIVSALIDRGDRNISQITDAVKARRGTASRRIVRERLDDLVGRGLVVADSGSRGRTFRVSDDVRSRWSQVLGFPKYGDRPENPQDEGDKDVG